MTIDSATVSNASFAKAPSRSFYLFPFRSSRWPTFTIESPQMLLIDIVGGWCCGCPLRTTELLRIMW